MTTNPVAVNTLRGQVYLERISVNMVGQIVNTARYPLEDVTSAALADAVARARRELAAFGCSVLPDFVSASCSEALRAECASVASLAYYEMETVNAYNLPTDGALPDDHPGRITMRRGNAFVARDRIPKHFVVHRLYVNDAFRRFVARCFGRLDLHELADPLAGLCLNVITPGNEHPWHFDTNEFAVSMLTQAPEGGGVFEYCPDIRSPRSENYADVRAVLTGRGEHLIHRLALRPGDLQLFQGRYSLHRVSAVYGDAARHSAIFAYSERPGVVGTAARTRQLFGRVLDDHRATGQPVRTDQLLD
jgi:hypothetical protein